MEEGSECILVVEYVVNGNFGEYLEGYYGKIFDMSMWFDIVIDVVYVLMYLYFYVDRLIIYCDIKLFNIFFMEMYCVKVVDFGFFCVGLLMDVGVIYVFM